MSDLDELKRLVAESGELSMQGRHAEAFSLIDGAILAVTQEHQPRWVKILCQHGAAISRSSGDTARTRYYCEQIVALEPRNAMARYILADLLLHEGEIDLARQYAMASYRAALDSNSIDDKEILRLITSAWPDLADAQ